MKKFLTMGIIFTVLSSTTLFAASCPSSYCRGNICRSTNASSGKTTYIITRCSPKYNCNIKQNSTTQNTTQNTTTNTNQQTTQTTNQQSTQKSTEQTTQTTNQQNTQQTIQQNVSNNQSNYAVQVLELVNNERAKNGLSPLVLDDSLSRVAQAKSEDMKNKNYFSHTSPTYGSPFDMMKQFGINYSYAGENIAKGQKTPEQVVNAWMNSEGHRANILNKNFTKMGVGYAASGSTTYWTQMFIR